MTYRILITGSRSWTDEQAIRNALAAPISQHGPEQVTVVHGACSRGADAIADRIASAWHGVTVERHPADWTLGRGAGFARNLHMVKLGADLCLAFVNLCTDPKCRKPGRHGTHGAIHCAHLARRAGIDVRRWPR